MKTTSLDRLIEIIAEELLRATRREERFASGVSGRETALAAQTLFIPPSAQTRCEAAPVSPAVPDLLMLVLFSGAPADMEAVCEQLENLREAGVPFAIVATEEFLGVHDGEALAKRLGTPLTDVRKALQAARAGHAIELLVWAAVGEQTVHRLVNGLTDTPEAGLLSVALKNRWPVLANAPGLWAQGPRGYSRDPQEALFRGAYAALERWGVKTAETGDLAAAALSILRAPDPNAARKLPLAKPAPRRVFLTLHDVQDAFERGQYTIHAPEGAVITDLAREFLAQNNMKIVSEGERDESGV